MGIFGQEKKSGKDHWLTGNLDRRKSSNKGLEGGLRNLGNKATTSAAKGIVSAFTDSPDDAMKRKNQELKEARIEREIRMANVTSEDPTVVCNSIEMLFTHLDIYGLRPDEKTTLAVRKIETGIEQLKYLNRQELATTYIALLNKHNKQRKIAMFFTIIFLLIVLIIVSTNFSS